MTKYTNSSNEPLAGLMFEALMKTWKLPQTVTKTEDKIEMPKSSDMSLFCKRKAALHYIPS